MFQSFTLLSLFVLVSTAFASPVQRASNNRILRLASKINPIQTGKTLPEIDRARVATIVSNASAKKNGKRADNPVVATDIAVVYTASVGVGNPPTQYTLIVDTGSSNTWVGAGQPYIPTNTSTDTGGTVSVTYGSGSFSGKEYMDTVTLSSTLVIKGQSIGVSSTTNVFSGFDGILGVGPVGLTKNTVSNVATVPTVVDNLFAQGSIDASVLGVFYEPTVSLSAANSGELSFGGPDGSKTTGPIQYVPITTMFPAGAYWGIDQSIEYGSTTILAKTAGIVDTGTTLIMIASDAFLQYQLATGGLFDSTTGLLKITPAQYAELQPLDFLIGKNTYSLSPNAQIWPRMLNTAIGGTANDIYLIVTDLGSNSGQGFDFINGFTFLQRFYSVYDNANSRVGFATTAYTDAKTN